MDRFKSNKQQHVVYGEPMPQNIDLEELCPPQETCPTCPTMKCLYTDIDGYVNVQPLRNVNFTGLPSRLVGKCFSLWYYLIKYITYTSYANRWCNRSSR